MLYSLRSILGNRSTEEGVARSKGSIRTKIRARQAQEVEVSNVAYQIPVHLPSSYLR